jgi:hypothetical protein
MAEDALCFAFPAGPGLLTRQALVLAASIRAFAGAYSTASIYGLLEGNAPGVDLTEGHPFSDLGVKIVHYSVPASLERIPFSRKVAAAAAAEEKAGGEAALLVWMDAHSLVVNPPDVLVLEAPFRLGCRPVDHQLIGSRYEEPADPFWDLIYELNQVPPQRLFPMTTSVDQVEIRPYINAGLLVVAPRLQVLRRWLKMFVAYSNDSRAHAFYDRDDRYRIFMHQALLSGLALSLLDRGEIKVFPRNVNVPLHLYEEMPEAMSCLKLDPMVTCRYDVRFDQPDWLDRLTLPDEIRVWLRQQWKQVDQNVQA